MIEAVYGPSGDLERFDATFELDSGGRLALSGRLQYHASARLGTSVLDNDTDADGDPLTAAWSPLRSRAR